VVPANFSDWGTADPMNPAAEYLVSNCPDTPTDKRWREITLDRVLPPGRAEG